MSVPNILAGRSSLTLAVTVMTALVGAAFACGGTSDPPTILLGADSGNPTLPKDGSVENRTDSAVPSGTLRLVHAAPGLPAIDFCTRSGPQDLFVGPVLGRDRPRDAGSDAPRMDAALAADAASLRDTAVEAGTDATVEDALAPQDAQADAQATLGVGPFSASQYVSVEGSGTLEVAIVPAGTGSCGQPLALGQVTLEPGRLKTVVVYGLPPDAGRSAGVAAFDDAPDVTPDRAKIRLIYATSGPLPRLTATLYSTLTTTLGTLEPLGALRAESDAAQVDQLGYANVDPRPPPTTLGLRQAESATPDVTQPEDLGITGGSLHTGFIVRTSTSLSLVYCNDVSTDGPRTQCVVVSFP